MRTPGLRSTAALAVLTALVAACSGHTSPVPTQPTLSQSSERHVTSVSPDPIRLVAPLTATLADSGNVENATFAYRRFHERNVWFGCEGVPFSDDEREDDESYRVAGTFIVNVPTTIHPMQTRLAAPCSHRATFYIALVRIDADGPHVTALSGPATKDGNDLVFPSSTGFVKLVPGAQYAYVLIVDRDGTPLPTPSPTPGSPCGGKGLGGIC